MLLTGQYINKVDEKGRVSIPAKLRSMLNVSQVIVTKGFDGECLSIFTPEHFEKTITNAISGEDGLQILSSVVRKFTRKFVSPSLPLEFDNAGRINLPQTLRDYASISLKSEIYIIGMGKYIEIWNKEKYEALDEEESISDLAEELSSIKRG